MTSVSEHDGATIRWRNHDPKCNLVAGFFVAGAGGIVVYPFEEHSDKNNMIFRDMEPVIRATIF